METAWKIERRWLEDPMEVEIVSRGPSRVSYKFMTIGFQRTFNGRAEDFFDSEREAWQELRELQSVKVDEAQDAVLLAKDRYEEIKAKLAGMQ